MKAEKILSIEAAAGGGSVALLAGRNVLQNWHSEEKISRSETLLSHIAELLERSETKKGDISRIAVSNGPGSYTGIRIGLATAMGLARALEIPCIGVSLLRALAIASERRGEIIVVVPIGRSGYCWQRFQQPREAKDADVTNSGNLDELVKFLMEYPNAEGLAQSDAFQDLASLDSACERFGRIVDFGRDLANAVGAASAVTDDGLRPFYAQETVVSSRLGV